MEKIENFVWQYIEKILFFIESSSNIEILIKGALLYLVFFWIALILWVSKDSINRTNNIFFHTFAIVLNIFLPILGLLLYLLIRPSRTLMDKYHDELELHTIGEHHMEHCIKCQEIVSPDDKFCGKCGQNLINKCTKCSKEFGERHSFCPFCGNKK